MTERPPPPAPFSPSDPPPPPAVQPPPPTGAPVTQGPGFDVPADAMVIARNCSKWFGDLVAVSDVSFAVGPGVTALLGPNGAGKSTMLRMLCGLAAPSQGSVEVMGRNPRTDMLARAHVGVAPQQEAVFESLTALEFVTMSAQLQGVPHAEEVARNTLGVVELNPDDRRRLPTYSKGMRQRVKLAQALVHDPEVLLLDEPLTGLDPRQRLHMVELVHGFGEQGRCVIVSSHVLEEVERFGSNVLVIAKGRLAAQGDFRAIRDLLDDRPRRVRIRTDRPRALGGALVAEGVISGLQLEAQSIEVNTNDARALAATLAGAAQNVDAALEEVKPLDEDLESVFRYLVERQ